MPQPSPDSSSAAWDQFLTARDRMLHIYDDAKRAAVDHPVQVHHGVAAEQAVREWLAGFLPRRFGVTAGSIRGQLKRHEKNRHFDIIIYDQLESPILWAPHDDDRSRPGTMRIIPVEHVCAVLEVKAALNRASLRAAYAKLAELAPFMEKVDPPEAPYPTHLRANAVLCPLFFELRHGDNDPALLDRLWELHFPRPVYGPIVLRGEGRPPNETGRIQTMQSDGPQQEMAFPGGLLGAIYISETTAVDDMHLGSSIQWSDLTFSTFAFDLLALMSGRPIDRFSSFHGIDFRKFTRPKKE